MGIMQRLAEIAGRKGYISARKTTRAAQRAGLSVCEYVEREWGAQGRTQGIVDRLASLGAFRDGARVVEIGTGTGRYLDLSLAYFKPSRVESYETDPGWARWLAKTYPVITSCETDGETLQATTTADLVQAHGVFVYLPFLVTCQYFREIWRVVAPGGMTVFDAFTEDCMGPEQVSAWLASPHRFPCILPRDYIVENFAANGFTLRDTFTATHTVGSPSRYFVFSRR